MSALRLLSVLVVALAFGYGGDAAACPVCQDALEKNREAFVYTTWLLTFVPLGMIGGIAWYVARKIRQADATEPSDTPVS